jgi:hypothetical protein
MCGGGAAAVDLIGGMKSGGAACHARPPAFAAGARRICHQGLAGPTVALRNQPAHTLEKLPGTALHRIHAHASTVGLSVDWTFQCARSVQVAPRCRARLDPRLQGRAKTARPTTMGADLGANRVEPYRSLATGGELCGQLGTCEPARSAVLTRKRSLVRTQYRPRVVSPRQRQVNRLCVAAESCSSGDLGAKALAPGR